MDMWGDKLKTALETAAVVGGAAAAGAYLGEMLPAQVTALQVIPMPIWVALGAGVMGGAARTLKEGIMAGTYTFEVNANTGLAVGALAAFMTYSNLNVPVVGASTLAHGFIAGALGGWFV
jgi:hypothetical protein